MTTEILLIRHGETDWNREKIFRGTHDVPLNDNGREQARLVEMALRSEKIDVAYTSPLSRAAETARIVLEPQHIEATMHEGLLDLSYGDWTGLKEPDVARQWPEELAEWKAHPHTARIPGGDMLKDVFDRVFNTMEAIARQHVDETVVLFAHRVVNKLLIVGALGLSLDRFPVIIQGNCGINRLKWTESGYLIESINDTSHIRNAGVDLLEVDF
jgi:broad specificity phosphatase PhoE